MGKFVVMVIMLTAGIARGGIVKMVVEIPFDVISHKLYYNNYILIAYTCHSKVLLINCDQENASGSIVLIGLSDKILK